MLLVGLFFAGSAAAVLQWGEDGGGVVCEADVFEVGREVAFV